MKLTYKCQFVCSRACLMKETEMAGHTWEYWNEGSVKYLRNINCIDVTAVME